MYFLALTLGHNSSAILIEDGKVLCGYEEERLSGIKSDSAFPELSIAELSKYYNICEVDTVYVSHWDTYGKLEGMMPKYWEPSIVAKYCPNAGVLSHCKTFTHHDAHMRVANRYSNLKGYTIVADGFGNFNEVLSIYYDKQLIHRSFGYSKSLGLLYQYTTAYLGMKMNQDEYKLLGYEVHVGRLPPQVINIIDMQVQILSKYYTKALLGPSIKPEFDALCNVQALPSLRENISKTLDKVKKKIAKVQENLGLEYLTKDELRSAFAYLVQSVTEKVLTDIVKIYGMKNVTLVGGVFYNVKVNNAIMNVVDNISVCPLAGDQGAGLGVYDYYRRDLQFPDSLCIGYRDGLVDLSYTHDKLNKFTYSQIDEALDFISACLREDKLVNIVHGDLEFGPRALGNTTTLMQPTLENVDYVNMMNGRSTVMPCAPIVSTMSFFKDHHKIVKSHEHMIITLDYVVDIDDIRGAAHTYPFKDVYSGRPQFVNESHWLYKVIAEFKLLVNTSFNKHGSPILFSNEQIIESFQYQDDRDVNDRMVTVIIA